MTGRHDRGSHAATRAPELRRRVAVEAARLMTEGGLRDYRQAKLKAAERLGIFDELSLPKNSEIEEALREHQRLFRGDDQTRTLRRLREVAREAMRFFSDHEPRLVGAVLEGTADAHSAVCLHLYSDQPNNVIAHLREHGIPYEEQTRRLRVDRASARDFPVLLFSADDAAIDITLLPYDLLRQAPLDRISEKPMQRASLGALEILLESR
ncbi:hypothetical protein [Dokdonella soli]|uniref:Nucleotidyltransferase n=1 Tax=Dokdonella soli TaxID=529810 RepID=A0ABN1IPM1_9GAMM